MTAAAPSTDRFFARTGVDPLTSAFDAMAEPGGHGSSAPATPSVPRPDAAGKIAAMKAAMPAHAIRIFEAFVAARHDPVTRAAIRKTLTAHARKTFTSLEEALASPPPPSPPASPRPSPPHPDGRRMPAAASWETVVRDTPPTGESRPLAIYAHFPFCAARCSFCPFYRYADPADWRPYYDALLAEIDLTAAPLASLPARQKPAAAVFFGGGTPSDLPGEALAGLIRRIREKLPVSGDAEITVEGRPSTFDAEKIALCRAAGANRFSLGVQTFDGKVRRAMGRKLDTGPLLRRLREIGAAAGGPGDAPVIVDLIYGLPGQTDESWARDLETAIAEEAVAGLDLYRLKVFPGSPLARLAETGRAAPAGEEIMARRFAAGVERLAAAGWRRISRWHWARPGARERSAYNRLAKGTGDIVAIGCGAGGRWQRRGFMNTPGLDAWHSAVASGQKPCLGWKNAPSPAWTDVLSEQIESCRLDPDAWDGIPPAAREQADGLLAQWTSAGLLAPDASGLALTLAGQYWSDRLMQAIQTVLTTRS